MITESTEPVELFYSYAHEDERLRNELEKHLALMKRQGLIAEWYDRNIGAGTEWASEIDTHLESARIILLLISPDFIASDYCYSIEMTRALERHEAGEAHVIPIILRPTDLKDSPFSKLQALPKDARPVTKWKNRDDAFLDVAEGIRKAISELSSTSSVALTSFSLLWNVPYRRNPFFTGREDILDILHKQLQAGKPTALTQPQAISGLGGIGKTQTAVEYAYRYRDEYHPILWATAASRESLIADFVTIAGMLNLPGKNAQDSNIAIAVVKRWLASHKDWLLILDNADDLEMASDFLPTDGSGHMLLTTRAQVTGTIANGIDLEKMDQSEGTLLLLRRARVIAQDALLDQANKEDRATAEAIVKALDGLPLALDQAGAYIEETQYDLAGYLELYRTRRHELLKRRSRLRTDHPEPVTTTWSLSLQQVEQANPAAADLLRLCAFLDPDAIPEEIITKGASDLGPTLETVATDPFKLNAAIEELRRFSLIRRNPGAKLLNIHRLVQAVLRDGMDTNTQKTWAERTVRAVNQAFPDVKVETWPQCKRCLPHALACAELIKHSHLEFAEAARLLNRAAVYLKDHGQYKQAEPLYEQALEISEKVLGPDDVDDTSTILNNQAALYREQGKLGEAEPLFQRALDIRKRALGGNLSLVAESLYHLAIVYYVQGKYEQAEPLYLRALAIRETQWGPDHPDTATSLDSLAKLYDKQSKYEQAEPLYLRALAIRETRLGPDHPDTALSLYHLATLYDEQGKYAEAEPLHQRALTIREQQWGPEHPDVAGSLNNLAAHYDKQSKYEQAEPLYLRALAIREMLLPEHSDTAITLNNLANLYKAQGQYAQAEPLYLRALEIDEKVFGLEHPNIVRDLEDYASLLRMMKRTEKAVEFEARAKSIRDKSSL